MTFKIGNIVLKNRIVLAPMAGISNTSYRKIIKEMGAGLIYAEMVSDKAIMYGNEKNLIHRPAGPARTWRPGTEGRAN